MTIIIKLINQTLRDMELFSTELIESFKCPICKNYITDDIISTGCGHNMCKDCAVHYRGKRKCCPLCREIVSSLGVNVLLKNIQSTIIVKCPNSSSGCEITMLIKDIHAHINVCDFEKVVCCNNIRGCKNVFDRKKIKDHELECKFSPKTCDLCEKIFPLNGLKDHLKICPKRIFKCECGEEITFEKKESHELCECSKNPIAEDYEKLKGFDFVGLCTIGDTFYYKMRRTTIEPNDKKTHIAIHKFPITITVGAFLKDDKIYFGIMPQYPVKISFEMTRLCSKTFLPLEKITMDKMLFEKTSTVSGWETCCCKHSEYFLMKLEQISLDNP
jgi:hypothetical protein